MALEMSSSDSMAELRAEVTQWWRAIHPDADAAPPFRILAQGKEIGRMEMMASASRLITIRACIEEVN